MNARAPPTFDVGPHTHTHTSPAHTLRMRRAHSNQSNNQFYASARVFVRPAAARPAAPIRPAVCVCLCLCVLRCCVVCMRAQVREIHKHACRHVLAQTIFSFAFRAVRWPVRNTSRDARALAHTSRLKCSAQKCDPIQPASQPASSQQARARVCKANLMQP